MLAKDDFMIRRIATGPIARILPRRDEAAHAAVCIVGHDSEEAFAPERRYELA
jgi:hypothetical protein